MAAVAAKRINSFASEMSTRIDAASTKVRGENPAFFDRWDRRCGSMNALTSVLWEQAVDLVTSPFFPYLFVTFLLNIPPFAYGLASVFAPDCSSSWLVYNAFLSAIHMGVSVYGVMRIRAEVKKSSSRNNKEETETPYVKVEASGAFTLTTSEPNSWDRIRVVMCYDMVMATYYILCVVWMIWQGIGTQRVIDGQVDNACGRWVVLSVAFGFLYMGLGIMSWVGSLCFLRYNNINGRGSSDKDILVVDDAGGVSLA